jgi:diacylglycerol kinase family enzyme
MGSSVSLGRAVVTGGCMMLHESETAEMRHPPKQGRRVIALLNAGAGMACQRGADGMRAALEPAFERLNILAELSFCSGSELKQLAEFALARAKAGEIDAVVVGGGDGSIRTVASVLADTGIPLGIVPLGTLNHFAKDLGLPMDLDAAAEVIATGLERVVDLAEVNGEVFINNSSIGIYPYVVIDRERRRTMHKLAKWLAMAFAFLRMVRHFPRRRLSIASAAWNRPYRTPCLFIGNNEYGMDFFTLGRRLHLDRAELWFYVVKQRRPLGFLWMVCRMCFGRLSQAQDIETFRLSKAEVRSKTSRLPVALDGEVEILHPPLRYRSRPGALRVIAPAV